MQDAGAKEPTWCDSGQAKRQERASQEVDWGLSNWVWKTHEPQMGTKDLLDVKEMF